MKIVWALLSLPLLAIFFDSALAQSARQGEIVNDKMSVKTSESGVYVLSIGEIQNNSDATLDDVIVEARYFNAKGQLVDATVERLYSIKVPPAQRVAFRLQSLAVADQGDYVSQQIRLISANEIRPCPQASGSAPRQSSGLVKQMLISSFPILLLIAVWIFFMRRFGGKNSVHDRTLALIGRQNEIVEKQSSAIERIAEAIESNRGDKET